MAVVIEKMSDGSWRSRQIGRWSGPIVPSRFSQDFCYICERPGADSIEHVVGECFLAGTVSGSEGPQPPTHACCNHMYSAPEEYVRNRLAAFGEATGRAAERARSHALAAYGLGERDQKGSAQKAGLKLARYKREVRRDGSVRLWIPEETDPHRWQAVFFKIVRGWAYSMAGLLLPWPAESEWEIHVPYEGLTARRSEHAPRNRRWILGDRACCTDQ
jgi:hypothetical protein